MILGNKSALAELLRQGLVCSNDICYVCRFSSKSLFFNLKQIKWIFQRRSDFRYIVFFQTELTLQSTTTLLANRFNFGASVMYFSPYILLKLIDEFVSLRLFKNKSIYVYLPKVIYTDDTLLPKSNYVLGNSIVAAINQIDFSRNRYYISSNFDGKNQPSALQSSVKISVYSVASFCGSIVFLIANLFGDTQNISRFDPDRFENSFMYKRVISKIWFKK